MENTATFHRPTSDRGRARPDSGVGRATTADADALSRTLASAFRGDPVFGWCTPDPQQRDRHLAPLFRVIVDALLTHGETQCAKDAPHPHDPHLYLWFVGVRSRLAGADVRRLPAYQEGTSERNRVLHERHGFVVTASWEAC